MYNVKLTKYGLRIDLIGSIEVDEALKMDQLIKRFARKSKSGYSALVDARSLIIPTPEVSLILAGSLSVGKSGKLIRVAFVENSPILKSHAQQMFFSTGVIENTRQIDALLFDDWETIAINWLENAIEPALTT